MIKFNKAKAKQVFALKLFPGNGVGDFEPITNIEIPQNKHQNIAVQFKIFMLKRFLLLLFFEDVQQFFQLIAQLYFLNFQMIHQVYNPPKF